MIEETFRSVLSFTIIFFIGIIMFVNAVIILAYMGQRNEEGSASENL